MRTYGRILVILLVVSMVLPRLAQADSNEDVVKRLGGMDRVGTAVAASQESYKDGADTVIIAGFSGEVDALTGTLLAGAKEAPLLLTNKDTLSLETKIEIERLGAKTVYILGGTTVVSETVETELNKDYIVKRIMGENRYGTAASVAKEVKGQTSHVFLALGWEILADALAIGPVSAIKDMPVFLTKKDKIPQETVQVMKDVGVTHITIVGGISAVSAAVEAELNKNYIVNRVKGDNREKTALAIAKEYFESPSNLVIAYGRTYSDALVGGYLGSKMNAPILLTDNVGLIKETETYIKRNTSFSYLLGGETVISNNTFNRVKELILMEDHIGMLNADKPAIIETNDKSGQTTHPSVINFDTKWNGYRFWMAHTPYKDTDEKLENPSIAVSDDGIIWKTPKGLNNPIDKPGNSGISSVGHMSDTDLIYVNGQLECFYRYTVRGWGEQIFRKTSKDGVNWSKRELIFEIEIPSGEELLSPALIFEDGLYKCWYVGKKGIVYYTTSTTGQKDTWTERQQVNIGYLNSELIPWHLSVYKENATYYLILNAATDKTYTNRVLAIGEGETETEFKNTKIVLERSKDGWDNGTIYRSCVIKEKDNYMLYYSAQSKNRTWGVGIIQGSEIYNLE